MTNKIKTLRAPFTWTSGLKVKLSFQGLGLIFMSNWVQIRIPRGQIGQKQPFASFQIRTFSDFRTRMCTGVHALTTKSSYFHTDG
jgi:hypothetical protein